MKPNLPICRSLFDRAMALAFLLVLAPVLTLIAFLLRTNTYGPIVVTDDFITADGTPVHTYRFRTTGRGTRAFQSVGRFLRLYSIDEFPGLWAIVRGEVSFTQFLKLWRSK
jgi:lipopolysaccharide/colanic/teichoic acid biosynthesis glycosyltransferase